MKKIVLLSVFTLFSTLLNAQNFYDELWKKVTEFEKKGLPKSALKEVHKIYDLAKKEQNSAQIIKSILFQSKFALLLEEDAQLKVVNNLKKEISQAKTPQKNMLESILANLYWQYFNQNRWRFYNRTHTDKKIDSVDFRTWDLQTIFNEINTHHQNALQNALELQQIKIKTFNPILEKQTNSEKYRPTVYDFIAHNALEFYKTGESNLPQPANKFEITDSKFLGDNATFLTAEFTAPDKNSQKLQALKLYKNLTLFHKNDKDKSALVALTLERLDFVKKYARFNDSDKIYIETLKKLQKKYRKLPISTEIDFRIAQYYANLASRYSLKKPQHQFAYRKALEFCETAIVNFPDSTGAKKCKNLKNQILAKFFNVKSEGFIAENKPSFVKISYKNVSKLFFRIYSITKNQEEKIGELYQNQERLDFIKKLAFQTDFQQELKSLSDFQTHTTEIVFPKLPQGKYLILTSDDSNFNDSSSYAYNLFQVTDIAYVQSQINGITSFQFVNRETGKPIADLKVHIENYAVDRYNRKIRLDLITNSDGFIYFKPTNYHRKVVITVSKKGKKTVFAYFNFNKSYRNKEIKLKNRRIFLFTDRSIYRPAQIVYFKGIAVSQEENKSHILANERITVTLKDVNYQTVKELEFVTNEFGSFSGEFILPNSGLTGNFSLEAKGKKQIFGNTSISVEEYKRPKFYAKFLPVKGTFKLNDSVTVKGQAIAYAGSTITDAKVVYRVKRMVQYPKWYYWYRPSGYSSEAQEITNGETTTNEKGEFTIDFLAKPDLSVKKDDNPIFTYEITADVTDINGETRSTQTMVKVGYQSITVSVTATEKMDKEQKGNSITVTTQNLNGEFIPKKGTLKIYKVKAPKQVKRERPWSAPDLPILTKSEWENTFPHDYYTDFIPFENLGEVVFQTDFDTEITKEIKLPKLKKWLSGKYVVIAAIKDKENQKITDKQLFSLFSNKDKKVADKQLFVIQTNKENYQPEDKIQVKIGSASKAISVVLQVEKNKKIVQTKVIHLSDAIKTIPFLVSNKDLGGFAIHYSFVNFNSFKNGTLRINVPYPKTDLEIETITFTDKLQPNQEQTWAFKIKGNQKDKVLAEVLASMYDASLDQFKPHQWQFNPIYHKYYYPLFRMRGKGFGENKSRDFMQFPNYQNVPTQQYDKLNWFGFSLSNSFRIYNNYVRKIRVKELEEQFDSKLKKGIVKGTVSDDMGPIADISVIVKGTTIGTVTDFDGKYIIKAKLGDILVFSHIAYENVEVKVKDKNIINVSLSVNDSTLEEVVVTAMSNNRKLKKARRAEAKEVLQGKAAGLAIAESDIAQDKAVGNETEQATEPTETDFSTVKIRSNFKETSFFYPHLRTDEEGNIQFTFTTPESLTKWKLQLLAHDKTLQSGLKTLEAVTQKDLMVLPNAPRFLRQGDTLVFQTKIANISNKDFKGTAQLQLFDAITNKEITNKLLVNQPKQTNFTVKSKENTMVQYTIQVPDDVQAVLYKIVAKAGDFSDGEQNILPVLTNRMLVTETLPMWLRSNQTKTFTLEKLKNNTSKTLKNQALTLEITSNPAWYAVQALPYLMEYPYECAEQTFSRYYANTLASHIANSNPKIQQVFNQWKNSDALLSNLEKNQELKSLIIQETPWLRDAQSETEQKKRIALLFDLNKMSREQQKTIKKLEQMQMVSGGFPWFKGSRYENRYITQHIVSGIGHLQKLGVDLNDKITNKITDKAIDYLDNQISLDYTNLLKTAKKIFANATDKEQKISDYLKKNHTSNFQIHYLYSRSFYSDKPIPEKAKIAISYYTNQAYKYWLDYNLYSKGLIALVAKRNQNNAVAEAILRSLKETSISNDELGMYWKENVASYFWYQAPIETQAVMIEVFSELQASISDIDNLKIWLLKNKQTNRWKTTKATTEAVYALLLQGSNWLNTTDFVQVKIGNQEINPLKEEATKVEAGTGYFKKTWQVDAITPKMAEVTLSKKGKGIAWGALYWQYFEDLDKITFAKTPLQITKKLFLKKNGNRGEVLTEITDKSLVKVGDLVRVRIELKVDRVMEFIHLKDMRASGFEPVNVLSRYKWQDGLGYYESTKDAATNFFISYLPKGVYVFEYDLRANNAGDFSNGITTIQSMYAPEFTSHSKGVRIQIKGKNT